MAIDEQTVRTLCDLAKLALAPDEEERMRADLGRILEYVAKLDELDTSDVPPTTHVLGLASPLRGDRVEAPLPASEALRNSPRREGDALVVPRVVQE